MQHTYMHAWIHTNIHTYSHTYIHRYVCMNILWLHAWRCMHADGFVCIFIISCAPRCLPPPSPKKGEKNKTHSPLPPYGYVGGFGFGLVCRPVIVGGFGFKSAAPVGVVGGLGSKWGVSSSLCVNANSFGRNQFLTSPGDGYAHR